MDDLTKACLTKIRKQNEAPVNIPAHLQVFLNKPEVKSSIHRAFLKHSNAILAK
jgi:hypothetical protein